MNINAQKMCCSEGTEHEIPSNQLMIQRVAQKSMTCLENVSHSLRKLGEKYHLCPVEPWVVKDSYAL